MLVKCIVYYCNIYWSHCIDGGTNLLPELPRFTSPYQGVLRLARCPVLHQLMRGVIEQAATPNSRLWSDKLLHEALYLCAVILAEEDSSHPESLAKMAATGKCECVLNTKP